MVKNRTARVSALIRQEISEVIRREVSDPGLGLVSVTEVRCSADLKRADCYFALLGEEETRARTWRALGRARGRIQARLAPRVRLRYMPELVFHKDETAARAARIAGLLSGAIQPDPSEPDL